MAFVKIVPRIATSIGVISIELYDGDGTNQERLAKFDVEIKDQDDVTMEGKRGELTQHLEPEDIAWLVDFQNRMRVKATTEILP